MIRFACPSCAAIYTVGDEKAGKTGKCPKCQGQFVIPAAPFEDIPPLDVPAPPPPPPAPLTLASPPPPPPPPAPAPEPPIAEEVNTVEIRPCPKCGAQLSVEAKDVGLDIECPGCQTVFKALAAATAPPPPPGGAKADTGTSKLVKLGSGTKRGKDEDDDDDDDRSRRKKKSRRRDNDDDDDEEEEEERRPKKRKTRTSSRPRGVVSIARLSVLRYGITSALVSMIMAAIIGFIYFLGFGCFGAMIGLNSNSSAGSTVGVMLVVFGLAYWVGAIVVGFIGGFIGGVIFAAIYNLVASWTGGVEMELE